MRRVFQCSIVLLLSVGLFSQAFATELWDPYLRGVSEGLAGGALPPPGVYGIVNNYWATYQVYDQNGVSTGTRLDALVEVPIVLWATGKRLLGGNYAVALALPFDYVNLRRTGGATLSGSGHWGKYNTVFVPGEIGWTVGANLHVLAGLWVYANDASSSPAKLPSGGGVGSGNGFWTIEPVFGASWLRDGWNISASMHYSYNFEDQATRYKSGQEIAVDYTATKTIGKLTIGVGAHQENQLQSDSGPGAAGCEYKHGCRVTNYGVGPLLSYHMGSVSLQFEYDHNLYAENDVAGEIYNVRIVGRF